MAMSPGTYLRMRREAAAIELAELSGIVPEVVDDPANWLNDIEADERVPSASSVAMLSAVFDFDRHVLDRLIDLHYFAADLPAPRLCRVCACSQWDPCIVDLAGTGSCHWVGEDLCSAHAGAPSSGAIPVPTNDVAGASAAA